MTAYSELVKKFREKNSKPKTGWKYESWGNSKVERLASNNPLNIPAHLQHQMEGGQLTPEEFYQNQSIPIEDRPFTGKVGGLVEPGVTHYGKEFTDAEAKARYGNLLTKNWSEMSKYEKARLSLKLRKITGSDVDARFNPNITKVTKSRLTELKNRGLTVDEIANEIGYSRGQTKIFLNKYNLVGLEPPRLTETEKIANVDAWEKKTGKNLEKEVKIRGGRKGVDLRAQVRSGQLLGVVPGEAGFRYTDETAAKHYGKLLKGKKWSEMSATEKTQAQRAKYGGSERWYVPTVKTPLQIEAAKQLEWVSKNAKNYSTPKLLQEKFMTQFKVKNLNEAAIFKNAITGRGDSRGVIVTDIPNLKGTKVGTSETINFSKDSTESRLFKVATLQNNKKAAKELKESFKFIHDNFGDIRKKIKSEKLTFEEAAKLLNKKNKVLQGWDLKGVSRGLFEDNLIEAGISNEHIASFRLVRQPFIIIDDIVQSLSKPGGAEEWGLNKAEVAKTQKGWEKIKQGQTQATAWIDNLESKIGKNKFRELFGKVIFEHRLAKRFGKDWSFLPRDYLLRGQVGNQAFNEMKAYTFDKPMSGKINAYKKAVAANNVNQINKLKNEITNFHRAFNNITEGYMKEYTPTFKEGKFEWKTTDAEPFAKQRIHRYDSPTLAGREMREMSTGMKKLSEAAKQIDKGGAQIFTEKQLGHIETYTGKQAELRTMIEKIGCPGLAAGGRVGFEDGTNCFLKGKEKIRTGQIKPGAEEFNFKKLAKLAGGARGIARVTGLGLAWEAAFAPIIVGWMGSEGESWERMKHELAYGPIWEALGVPPEYVPGKSAKDEQIEYFGKPGYNVARIDEIGNEFANLKAQEAIEIYKSSKIGGDRPYETQSLKQIRDQMKKLKDEYMQVSGTFYEGPAGQHVGYEKLEQALQDKDWGEFDLQMDKEARKEELRKKGFLAEKDWMKNANLGYDNYLPDIDDDN